MSEPENLDYLSIIDPGHASVVWPSLKDSVAFRSNKGYLEQIRRVFRFNLLWRRSISLRHIDIFNNVALMEFLCDDDAAVLSAAGCLRLIVRDDQPIQDSFADWALSGGSQHWHHLSPARQKAYDQKIEADAIKSIGDLEKELHLRLYGLDLQEVLMRYEERLGDHRIALAQSPISNHFAQNVLTHWNDFLVDPLQTSVHNGHHLDSVSSKLAQGAAERWRRRRFFTELESLEAKLPSTQGERSAIATAKIVAVNAAFYDELEQMHGAGLEGVAPVTVSRDITYLANQVGEESSPSGLDPHLGSRLKLYDGIKLRHIAKWHTATDDDSRAFQASVRALSGSMRGASGSVSKRDADRLADLHIKTINACIDRAVREGDDLSVDNQTSLIQFLLPNAPDFSATAVGAGISLIGAAVGALSKMPEVEKCLVGSAFTIAGAATAYVGRVRVPNKKWRDLQCIQKRFISGQIGPKAR